MEKNKTIKIFLASSNELSDDREKFGNFIRGLDNNFEVHGMRIKVFMWEDYAAKWKGSRKQNEYNREARKSDYFLALFHAEGGDFTIEEFDEAMDEYQKSQSPNIYVYMKDLQEGNMMSPKLEEFKKRLDDIGLYWTPFYNQDSLRLHFFRQFLLEELDSIVNLKLEENGKVTLEGTTVAEMSNLPIVANNEDYQRISGELLSLPEQIAVARKVADEHPDNGYLRSELQNKLDLYNALKKEFVGLQKTLFEMSQVSARIQREQLGDKLREATEATESGNKEKANSLLSQIVGEAESVVGGLKKLHEPVHQGIGALLLQAKNKMTEVKTPIEERIKQVQAIYAKADQWAKNSALPDEKYERLLDDYASSLYDYGLYKEAEPVYLRLIYLREKLYGKEHENTATSYDDIGEIYRCQGNYIKSQKYLYEALKIRKKVLPPDHPDIATSYNNIGALSYRLDFFSEALEYHKKALSIRKKTFGEKHPETALSYNFIGLAYDGKGEYENALENLMKALDIWRQVSCSNHSYIAVSYNNIGGVYRSLHNYSVALKYYKNALIIKESELGKEHPSTATTYHNIGVVYDDQNKLNSALELYNKALNIRQRKLDPTSPSIAISYDRIGGVYMKQRDYQKALDYYQKALEIREQALGPGHPRTATSYNNIDMVYKNQGNYGKAFEYLGKALDISERVLGLDHPDTALSYNNIGSVYDSQGDYAKALGYYRKALDILERKLGPDHPKTKAVKENIEICHKKIQG